MPTLEEVAKQPLEQRLGRMSRTAEDLAAAIRGQSEAALVRRPDSKNWAANEVICHLRDIEEVYFVRIHAILYDLRLPRFGPDSSPQTPCGPCLSATASIRATVSSQPQWRERSRRWR